MNRKYIQKQSGFTLVELLLGVTISVMIFLTASSFILLLFNTDLKSRRSQALEQAKYAIGQEISTAIKWAQKIDVAPNQITIDDSTVYKLQDGQIFKNGDPITPDTIEISNLEIKDYSVVSSLKSLEISMQLSFKNYATIQDTYKITASQRLLVIEGEDIPDSETLPPSSPGPGSTDDPGGDGGDEDTGGSGGGDDDGGTPGDEGPPPGR